MNRTGFLIIVGYKELINYLNMKLFTSISLCLLIFGCSVIEIGSVCDIDLVKIEHPDYEYSGPLKIEIAEQMYLRQFTESDSLQAEQNWLDFSDTLDSSESCIYEFISDDSSWESLSGVRGFISLRENQIFKVIVSKKS